MNGAVGALVVRLRNSRIGRNAAYNLVGWLAPLAANLVVLPYAVRKIGPEQYGIFVLVTSVVGFLGLLELGLGNAIIKYVAEYAALERWDLAYCAISSAVVLLAAIGAMLGIALFIAAPRLTILLLKGETSLYHVTVVSLRVAAGGVLVSMAISPLSGVPQALQRYGAYSALVTGFGILNALATVAVLAMGFGLLGLVVMTVAIALLMGLGYAGLLRALMPGFRFIVGMSRTQAAQLLSFGGYTLVGRVSYLINTQAFRLIVGVVLGAAAVTYFTVTSKAVLAIAGIFSSITNVLVPAASEAYARGDLQAVLRLLRKTARIIGSTSAVPFLLVAAFSGPALSLWMGSEFAHEAQTLLVILCVAHYLYSLAMPANSIALGLGYAKMVSYIGIGASAAMCVSVIPMAQTFGIEGVGGSVLLGAATGLSIHFVLLRALRRGGRHGGYS